MKCFLTPLKALLVCALVAMGMSTSVLTASNASAATQQNCFNGTGADHGAWTASQTNDYKYAPGGWCFHSYQTWEQRLVWQSDGNLVWYQNGSSNDPRYAIAASNTAGRGGTLWFRKDGSLFIVDSTNHLLWHSPQSTNHSASSIYRMNIGLTGMSGIGHLYIHQTNPDADIYSIYPSGLSSTL